MSQIPVETETTSSYEAPKNIQFAVFLDNRVGRLLDLMEVFEGQALTVASFCVLEAANHAVIRLLTSNCVLARRLLSRHGLAYSENEVLVVELGANQTCADVLRPLLSAELSILYAYPLVVQPRGRPAMVVAVDDVIMAGQILRRKMYTLLAENDLGDNSSRGLPGDPSAN